MTIQQRWADPLDAGTQQPQSVVLFQDEIAEKFQDGIERWDIGTIGSGRFIGVRAGRGLVARDQAELRLGLSDGAAVIGEHGWRFRECYLLVVACACGQTFRYAQLDDIPAESVTCECGRPIIQYTEATP